jgi:hypothetical protein
MKIMRFLAIKNRPITGRYQQWYLAELFQLSGLTQKTRFLPKIVAFFDKF